MIVIVAGMPRSGSTFSFNIVRELLLARGTVAWAAANRLPVETERTATDHFILKCHSPDAEVLGMIADGRAKALCTYRKPEDAIASWAATFGFDLAASVEAVRSWLAWHSAQHGTRDLDYRQIESDPLGAISAIQTWLLEEASEQEARGLLERYNKGATYERVANMPMSERTVDIGFSYYDPQSFLHRRHVRSLESLTAADTLSAADIARVREVLSSFVDADGLYRPA